MESLDLGLIEQKHQLISALKEEYIQVYNNKFINDQNRAWELEKTLYWTTTNCISKKSEHPSEIKAKKTRWLWYFYYLK